MSYAEDYVANGVEWLNENGPAEWWNLIDLETLDILMPRVCVLGQVFALDADVCGFSTGYTYVLAYLVTHEDGFWIQANGFCDSEQASGEELTAVWIATIESIRELVSA